MQMIDKNSFRKGCIKRLKAAQNIRRFKKDRLVLSQLYQTIKAAHAKNIVLYIPMAMEVNLYPLINQLRKEQKNVYVPFMEGKSFRVVKYRLPLRKKQFGIKEPNDSKQFRKKQIDILIVPIVGMDVTRRRVGFGKGMYDRFFEKEQFHIKKVIFVARELCYTPNVVTDHYDVNPDIIITP
jgi:5-formyltetrahydrofolate cyclo-ligase